MDQKGVYHLVAVRNVDYLGQPTCTQSEFLFQQDLLVTGVCVTLRAESLITVSLGCC